MKLDTFLLPASAAAAAALVLWTGDSRAYILNGSSLGLSQRDVRVFDNFTDASANDNTTPDPKWPGYTGAELAIWKACSEWGSSLHGGTGAGDPLQTVGSGGANFDISWQGLATDVGGTNDNIHSQIAGSQFGLLAFTELPSSDGWRIRYYENWEWHDGPGAPGGVNNIDLQGVATVQYGLALGLNFDDVPGATMSTPISGSGIVARSIEADDIAGLQAIYGAKSPAKPSISNAVVGGNVAYIAGSNFSASNNEVWFTQAGQGGTGDPIVVTGVTSIGTSISVAIPGTAGPGDVLVRNNGTGFANLSNAWPIDTGTDTVCSATNYCVPKLSSHLCVPLIGSTGTPSMGAAGLFVVTTTGMESNLAAVDIFGTTGQAAVPFQGGTLCIGSPVWRLPGKFSGGGAPCTGSVSYTLQEIVANPAGGSLVDVGTVVRIQTWGRDLGDAFGSSLSDGLEFSVCP